MGADAKAKETKKKVTSEERTTVEHSETPRKVWTMDFIHEGDAEGRRLKTLKKIDHVTNASPVLEATFSMSGKDASKI